MKLRRVVGALLVVHGLGHAALGMAAQDDPTHGLARLLPEWSRSPIATLLFLVVTPGFIAAGFGAWRVLGLRRFWLPLVKVAVLGSFLLFAFTAPSPWRLAIGILLDLAVLALADLVTPPSDAPRARGYGVTPRDAARTVAS